MSKNDSRIYLMFQLTGGSGKKAEIIEKNKSLNEELNKMKLEMEEMKIMNEELKKYQYISQKSTHKEPTVQVVEEEKEKKTKTNIKIVKLKNMKSFDGGEEFKDWVKVFNTQMSMTPS